MGSAMLLPPGGRRRNQINGWMSAAAAARSSYATLAQFKWEPVERALVPSSERRWYHLEITANRLLYGRYKTER